LSPFILCDIMWCSLLKDNRLFGGTFCIFLRGRRISQERKVHNAGSKYYLFPVCLTLVFWKRRVTRQSQSHKVKVKKSKFKVKVTLQPTINRPVRLGVRRPSGTRDQFFYLLEIFFWTVTVSYVVEPSLTRERVCNLV
jgi:hypothetical protein